MVDRTEGIRKLMLAQLSITLSPDAEERYLQLVDQYGEDDVIVGTDVFQEKYEIIGFSAPFVVVKRKADGVKGSFMFAGLGPRFYFGWEEHKG